MSGSTWTVRGARVGPWMGVAFAVLFVGGFLVFSTPSDNKDTAKWQAWWNSSGHRASAIIGAYLMVLGALAFAWFVWSLNDRLRGGGLMVVFGSLFSGIVLVSALVRATIPGSKQFGSTPLPTGPDFARLIDQIGVGMLVVSGALAAGAFIALASYAARRRGALPAWLTTAGFVVAVLQLFGALFIPFVLVPLWVLVASIVLLRSAATSVAAS